MFEGGTFEDLIILTIFKSSLLHTAPRQRHTRARRPKPFSTAAKPGDKDGRGKICSYWLLTLPWLLLVGYSSLVTIGCGYWLLWIASIGCNMNLQELEEEDESLDDESDKEKDIKPENKVPSSVFC